MCGIFCGIFYGQTGCLKCTPSSLEEKDAFGQLTECLKRRGPDSSCTFCIPKSSENEIKTDEQIKIHLESHVLWTNGSEITSQPYKDDNDYFLFNGDLYNYNDEDGEGEGDLIMNDGLQFFNDMKWYAESDGVESFPYNKLNGPCAFIYVQNDGNSPTIWFGRDFLGKSSLILNFIKSSKCLLISSVAVTYCDSDSIELPPLGLYKIKVIEESKNPKIQLICWDCELDISDDENGLKILQTFCSNNQIDLEIENEFKIQPNISTKLVPLAEDFNQDYKFLQIQKLISIQDITAHEKLLGSLDILKEEVIDFINLLKKSILKRIQNVPRNACISLLFSGGIDSNLLSLATLSILQDKECEYKITQLPVELLNVAFYPNTNDDSSVQSVPDRITSIQSYDIMHQVFPLQIILKCINISKSEVELMRKERTRDLISPLSTVLDDSIGCCLWFASRDTSSKIILVGSGADELFGGYSRHRSAFSNESWSGLQKEMQRDINRISSRNLGRDNRILSDHSISPRIPFLDEELVSFVTQLPLFMKYYPGFCDKLLLRLSVFYLLCTNSNVNVNSEEIANVCLFPKRAMQFGSKIAKLENSKEKGHDKCKRLTDSDY